MDDLVIQRLYRGHGTYGWMRLNDVVVHTVERPWVDNRPYISCIPEGRYFCSPRRYNKGGYDAYEITNVPGRTHILFHKANKPGELAGCVAPNLELRFVKGEGRGVNSKGAFDAFMAEMNSRSFWLDIIGINTPRGAVLV